MKRIVLAALTLPIFLVGCGSEAPDTTTNQNGSGVHDTTEVGDGSDVEFFVKTIDGVKCRVAVIYLSVAMDCEDGVDDGLG